MSYESKSVKEIIEMIGESKVYLPAIQRKFVWEHEKIESLFDSIMRGYPIGTFLFWFVKGEKKDEYTFYKFLDGYHERDKCENVIAPKPELKEEIIGILDGQQRLSSMYIPLQYSYAYKRPHARKESSDAYPERWFYLNILREPKEEEDQDFIYEFKFLTETEAKQADKDHLWFPVKNVLTWGIDPEIDSYYDELLSSADIGQETKDSLKDRRMQVKKTLRILHQRLVIEKLINYFKVTEPELDNILDIFIRVNSGGTPLTKSDLLFSTIVANWEEGRKEIEEFLKQINNKGDRFRFDIDFMMRSCLVLTDCPVLFKVNTFKKENIDKIKSEWEKIKTALDATVDLLVEFGFNEENLTSQNAIIPIAYYLIKNGNSDISSKTELRKYLVHSLLKGTYGGQGDRVLSNIRECLRKEEPANSKKYVLKQSDFLLNQLFSVDLPSNRSLKISDDDIDEILDYSKGAYTFMVLSLLYPSLKFGQVTFHQDHIHPESMFTNTQLTKNNIAKEKWEEWQQKRDKLPNLQLMEGKENESKNKTPFKDWLYGKDSGGYPNVVDPAKFKKDNYISETISLDFKDFEMFYEERKKLLKTEIKRVLQWGVISF
jgi:uncharacterized protein with ParB-like and HNH nuclease domain